MLNARVEVRLAEHEKLIWGAVAAEEGLGLSEWLRRVANDYVTAQADAPVVTPQENAATVAATAGVPGQPIDQAPVGRPFYDSLCPVCAAAGAPRCELCRFRNRSHG